MAMADAPNYNEMLDQPSYHNVPHLGNNATTSVYTDRLALANEEEATTMVLKPADYSGDNFKDLLRGMGNNMVVFSFTETEYNLMLQEHGGTVGYISGDVRKAAGWGQTIGTPTVQDSANQLMWRVSKSHSVPEDKIILAVLNLHLYNRSSHLATRSVNNFQRAYSLQIFQVLQGFSYNLSPQEQETMVILKCDNYNVLQLANRWCWSTGWVWAYPLPINVGQALLSKNHENNSVLTAMKQGIHNGGNYAMKMFPQHLRVQTMEFYVEMNLSISESNILPSHNLGHPDHVEWLLTKSNEPRQMEDNDETMPKNKKRKELEDES